MPKNLHWTNFLFFAITTTIALIFVPIYFMHHSLSLAMVIYFVVLYSINNLSITVGYHRYFAHRSYDAHPFMQFLMALVGAGAFQGPVVVWATDHRRHHREIDGDDDPYNIGRGFWYAHMGWMLEKIDPKYLGKYAPDLERNKFLMLQDKYYVYVASFMGFVVPALIGWELGFGFWGGLLIGGCLRIVLTQHSTFFINSFCHIIGRRPYSDKISARDSFIMAVLTFGEGYHNYHHQFQIDYRNGIYWYQWDPSKWSIQMMSWTGLVYKLRRVAPTEILKARLSVDEERIVSSGACRDTVAALRTRTENASARMRALREEYLKAKAEWTENSRDRYRTLKAEMRLARREFRKAHTQWVAYCKNFQLMQPVRF